MIGPDSDLKLLQLSSADGESARLELAQGLAASPAHVSPKFFYDELGSRLFAAITALPEYYPTRTEASIFAAHAQEMAAHVGQGRVFIDLGAANCEKAASLFAHMQPQQYVPIDISADYLASAARAIQARHPQIPILALGLDLSKPWHLPDALAPGPRTLFYPGSSIGNFEPLAAQNFLRHSAQVLGLGGTVLIGVDLVKGREVLEPAYDDALGVTAAFNRNVLTHANAVLRANFSPALWAHVAFFNAEQSRIELHLEAKQALHVQWSDGERTFKKGERIHTEYSYKYTPDSFERLLTDSGLSDIRCWTDSKAWFGVFAARVQ